MEKILALIFIIFQSSTLFSQENKMFESPGAKLHYQSFGSGTPLLILNGGPGMSSEGFIPLAKELSKNNRTIIYDQRGTGQSKLKEIDASTVNMDLMVNDIEILRENLGIKRWIIMGHSFGGILAYYYATKYPDRIIAMIQSSSGGMDLSLLNNLNITETLLGTDRDSLSFYSRKIANGDSSYGTSLKRGTFLAAVYVYDRKNIPDVAKRLTQGNGMINRLVWQDLRRIDYDTKTVLKEFHKPVLIIHGREDIVGLGIPKKAHEILPNSELVILEKTRHYGWLDNPEMYFSKIQEFLNKVSKIGLSEM